MNTNMRFQRTSRAHILSFFYKITAESKRMEVPGKNADWYAVILSCVELVPKDSMDLAKQSLIRETGLLLPELTT